MKNILKFFAAAILIWIIPVFFICGLVAFAYDIPFREALQMALFGLPAFFSGALGLAALIIAFCVTFPNE